MKSRNSFDQSDFKMKSLDLCWFQICVLWITVEIAKAEIDTVYDTKKATSDLDWTLFPPYNGWEEVSSLDLDGSTIRSYQVCNIDQPDQNNWMRSPYIDIKQGRRVYIDIEYSVMKCPGCKETFTLYYYPSSEDVASSTFPPWRENPYIKLDTLAASEQFASHNPVPSGINRKTLEIDSLLRSGFYIAIKDQGACMSIMSLKVYYHFCPEVVHNLTRFPRTAAGDQSASLVSVEGKCEPNAVFAGSQTSVFRCNSNGQWTVPTSSCVCEAGYTLNTTSGSCQECLPGFFKQLPGNRKCEKCPLYSKSTDIAATFCACADGFFRSKSESVKKACSGTPSPPYNLTSFQNTSLLHLFWLPPLYFGGRNDLYYSILCQECDKKFQTCTACKQSIKFSSNPNHVTTTSIIISQLEPLYNYMFKVSSLNGVSEISLEPAASATIKVSTQDSYPSVVDDVVLVKSDQQSLFIKWSPSEMTEEEIEIYQIQYQEFSNQAEESVFIVEVNGLNATINNLKSGTDYLVRIRPLSSLGYGLFSAFYSFSTSSTSLVSKQTQSKNIVLIVAGVAGGVALVLILIISALLIKRRNAKQIKKTMINSKLSDESRTSMLDRPAVYTKGENTRKTYVDYRDPHKGVKEVACEIKPSQVKVECVVGQGEFAEVCKGKLLFGKKGRTVAVKRLRYGASLIDQTNFFREACTMAQFSHPNVVEFKGIVTKCVPPMIITEFMENGSLDRLLQKKRGELSLLQLLKMLKGISSGMNYLSSIKYVHRDLAARNILVDSELNCKVSDFGLSRTLENNPHAVYTTQGGKIALRWTAPECIRCRQFSSASDVWSFGIVMWEVMSYGEKPYWDMSNDDVSQVVEDGYRLPAPAKCPQAIYDLMLKCWLHIQTKRPTFQNILNQIDFFIKQPSFLASGISDDLTTPLITPVSSTPFQDATNLNQWLEVARMSELSESFNSQKANEVETLSRLSTSDFERLGIILPEQRTSLQNGLDSVRRHLNSEPSRSTSQESQFTNQATSMQSSRIGPSAESQLQLNLSEPAAFV